MIIIMSIVPSGTYSSGYSRFLPLAARLAGKAVRYYLNSRSSSSSSTPMVRNYAPARTTVSTTRTVTPARSSYSRPSRSRRYRSRRPSSYRSRRLRRSVAPRRRRRVPYPRRNAFRRKPVTAGVYNKRRKTMRPFNRGRFTLSKFMMEGGHFPMQTFVRMKFRDTYIAGFNSTGPFQRPRIYCLNSLNSFRLVAQDGPSSERWMYFNTLQTFYRQYLVLGNRTVFTISRPNLINNFAAINPGGIGVGVDQFAGYWYVRVFYNRGTTANPDTIGHPIREAGDFIDAWPDQRTFLADPTVTWVKDKLNYKMTTGFRLPAVTGTLAQPGRPIAGQGDPIFSVDYESTNKLVRLAVNFSYKKHFQDNNPLKNGHFQVLDDLSIENIRPFFVFVGYVSFSSTGSVINHCPMDRVLNRQITVDSQSYVALKGPQIEPTGDSTLSLRKTEAIRQAIREQLLAEERETTKNLIEEKDVSHIANIPLSEPTPAEATPEWEKLQDEVLEEVDAFLENDELSSQECSEEEGEPDTYSSEE